MKLRTIRNEQMNVLRLLVFRNRTDLGALVRSIKQSLRDREILSAAPRPAAGAPPSRGELELDAQIGHEIEQAVGYGFASQAGLIQFVSYRFMVGPDWAQKPAVSCILSDNTLSEYERLFRIHRLVQEY
jgi:hypothetical protein